MKFLIALFIVFSLNTSATLAKEVELNADYKLPEGRGLVIFTLNSLEPFPQSPNYPGYSVRWRASDDKFSRDSATFSRGKYPRNLVEKYQSDIKGRLIALELRPGDYALHELVPELLLPKYEQNLEAPFTVVSNQIRYLGHIELSQLRLEYANRVVALLFLPGALGSQPTGFFASIRVYDHSQDIKKVLSNLAPQISGLTFSKSLATPVFIGKIPHTDIAYAASNFAEVSNFEKTPFAKSEDCKKNYQQFLEQKSPRAFVFAGGDKECFYASTAKPAPIGESAIPAEYATSLCKRSHNNCLVYAVDDRVVYEPDRKAKVTAPHPIDKYPKTSDLSVESMEAYPSFADAQCKDKYADFLKLPIPRAFLINKKGQCSAASNRYLEEASPTTRITVPAERLKELCHISNHISACFIYAVDDRIVYVAP